MKTTLNVSYIPTEKKSLNIAEKKKNHLTVHTIPLVWARNSNLPLFQKSTKLGVLFPSTSHMAWQEKFKEMLITKIIKRKKDM